MKAIVPNLFVQHASQFTLESMIIEISLLSLDIFNDKNDINQIGKSYSFYYDSKQTIPDKTIAVQTKLIDLLYTIATLNTYGDKTISKNDTIKLVALHNTFLDSNYNKNKNKKEDIFLYLYGFFGEQRRFQQKNELIRELIREKYILEYVSKKNNIKNTFGIDVKKEFFNNAGMTTDDYTACLFIILAWFLEYPVKNGKIDFLNFSFNNKNLNAANCQRVLEHYSSTIQDIKSSNLKRQVFYSKPIIKMNQKYILSNPFLLISLLINSNYWIMRNIYMNKGKDKQKFTNAFGVYFELYVEEILNNCLKPNEFKNLESGKTKCADWHLKIDAIDLLVEQKSSLSLLSIKQNEPDMVKLKEHVTKKWGEAITQLKNTAIEKNLENAIKIILVYENYYKSESLDEYYRMNPEIENDGTYWLMNIDEFETLMYSYLTDPTTFNEIINQKKTAEINRTKDGSRDFYYIFKKKNIHNNYLKHFEITKIIKDISENFDKLATKSQ